MATNPMKKRARNSFLLGVLITMVIAVIPIYFLYAQVQKEKEAKVENEITYETAFVLLEDVKSGEPLKGKFVEKQIDVKNIPGNKLKLDDLKDYAKVDDGTSVSTADIAEILDEKVVAKIELATGTILTKEMFVGDEETSDDMRIQEYNMIILPTTLAVDEYIDVRLQLPTGEDFIVVPKKRVINTDASSVWVEMAEEETLLMSNAIVENYIMAGSKLYATKYVEPGMQKEADTTYVPSERVENLLNSDNNIVSTAQTALNNKFTLELRNIRATQIQSNLDFYSEDALTNIETGIQTEITNRQQARQEYIEALEAGEVIAEE